MDGCDFWSWSKDSVEPKPVWICRFVQSRRFCVSPNSGFLHQLDVQSPSILIYLTLFVWFGLDAKQVAWTKADTCRSFIQSTGLRAHLSSTTSHGTTFCIFTHWPDRSTSETFRRTAWHDVRVLWPLCDVHSFSITNWLVWPSISCAFIAQSIQMLNNEFQLGEASSAHEVTSSLFFLRGQSGFEEPRGPIPLPDLHSLLSSYFHCKLVIHIHTLFFHCRGDRDT